jgi:hypothetical protein
MGPHQPRAPWEELVCEGDPVKLGYLIGWPRGVRKLSRDVRVCLHRGGSVGVPVPGGPPLLVSSLYLVVCRLLALLVLLARGDRSKELEILVIRHELAILRRQAGRPRFAPSDRLMLAALSRVAPRRCWRAFPVRPETLLRWHRRLVALGWTYPHRRPGRPRIDGEVRELILRLARENISWGYVRIVGELRKLEISVSATLVRSVLADGGIPPAPQRDGQSWRSFLRQQGESMLACDFLHPRHGLAPAPVRPCVSVDR